MNLNKVGPCPKCLEKRPFIERDQELMTGQEYFFSCRICGAVVEIYLGPRAMTLSQSNDKQRKLFD